MPIPEHLSKDFESLPNAPGVYIYKDDKEREIYVGKAASLRKRVRQYFDDKRALDRKTLDLVARIQRIDFIECGSEVEAYLLENRLIKDLQPIFNMHAKSDINFPVVEITDEDFPRVRVTRDRSNKNSRYYGPFVSASWLRVALQVLQRVFKFCTCNLDIKEGDPKNRFRRPCLEYYIGRCKGPCAGLQSSADYKANIRRLALFLQGRCGEVEKELQRDMKQAASQRRYEEAAALRDTLQALSSLRQRGSLEDGLEPSLLHIDPRSGVAQLHEILNTPLPPRYIEGIDIAHLQGMEQVGSLVSFFDGLPSREGYRRFRIKTVEGADDFASIREIVTRRYGRLLREGTALPDLILIDGGLGQLSAAREALEEVMSQKPPGSVNAGDEGLNQSPAQSSDRNDATTAQMINPPPLPPAIQSLSSVPLLASLAKKEEIVHTLAHPEGLRLPRRSPGLRLLQYVRDEAHRFAQHYHHILRRKRVLQEGKVKRKPKKNQNDDGHGNLS